MITQCNTIADEKNAPLAELKNLPALRNKLAAFFLQVWATLRESEI